MNFTKNNFLSDSIKCVGIVAPSSPIEKHDIQNAISFFESYGIKVKYSERLFDKERFLAGSDDVRASQVMSLFADKEVQVIFSACGGYGSIRILDKLDYSLIRQNAKPFVGFSDTTALQLALLSKANLPSISGITLKRDFTKDGICEDISETISKCLSGERYSLTGTSYGNGVVQGKLVGGCLSLITPLFGTGYLPDFRDSILLLEDVGEEPYKIDRMINQLYLSGVFTEVKGIVIGQFKDCIAKDKEDGTVYDVIEDMRHMLPDNLPVIMDVQYGHHDIRKVLPIGGEVTLDANKGLLFVERFSVN